MRATIAVLISVLAVGALGPSTTAQSSLPISLFERYVESLRRQTGIPGLSAAILQDGRLAWEKGFGYQDVAGLVAATPDTPYPIAGLSQTLSATLLLHRCVERSHLDVDDQVRRWDPNYADDGTTVAQLLSNTSSSGNFNYNPARFAALTPVLEQCVGGTYPQLVRRRAAESPGHVAVSPRRRPGRSAVAEPTTVLVSDSRSLLSGTRPEGCALSG